MKSRWRGHQSTASGSHESATRFKLGDIDFGEAPENNAHIGVSSDGSRFVARVSPIDVIRNPEAFAHEIASIRLAGEHSSLLPLTAVVARRDAVYEIYPFSDLGSAFSVLDVYYKSGVPEKACKAIAAALFAALNYLHSTNIVHRAVRAEHLMLDSRGGARLSGMRWARRLPAEGRLHGMDTVDAPGLLWTAPEVLAQDLRGYNCKADIYSAGITLCELANGFPPFADMEKLEMLYEKLRGTTPRLLDSTTMPYADPAEHYLRTLSSDFHDITDQCLKQDPSIRPTSGEVLMHKFIAKTSKRKLGALLPLAKEITSRNDLHSKSEGHVAGAAVERKEDVGRTEVAWQF